MDISSTISKTRGILRDPQSSAHYSDDTIKSGIESAVRHLCSVRPECRYGATRASLHDADDIVKDYDVDPRFEDGIAFYAASRCLDTDSVDTVNLQLAQSCLQRAIQEFQK